MDRIFLSSAFRRTARTAMLVIAACAGLAVLFVGLINPARIVAWITSVPPAFAGVAISVLVAHAAAQHRLAAGIAQDVPAQPAHLGRARQHDPRPVHVRRRGPADPLQRALPRDVRPDAQAGPSRRHACANCSNSGRANGTFHQDIDEYVAGAKRRVVEGKVFNNIVEVRGRTISINNRPARGRRLGLDPRRHFRAAAAGARTQPERGAGRSAAPPWRPRSRCSVRASRPC